MREARLGVHALDHGMATAAVLHNAGPEVGESVRLRAGAALRVDDHVVVVQVRDRTAAVAVEPERERADHVRLEVVHEVAADEARRVRDLGSQQEARGLPRTARDHDDARAHLLRVPLGIEVAHAACRATRRIEEHALDE